MGVAQSERRSSFAIIEYGSVLIHDISRRREALDVANLEKGAD